MDDHYGYRVLWSPEDGEYLGLCAEFPSLSHLAADQVAALVGIRSLVNGVVADMRRDGEPIPEPLASLTYSNGRIVKEERFPFHLESGSRNWTSGSIWGRPDGSSGASFMTTEFGIPSSTLDHQTALKSDKNIREVNKIQDSPAWWWPW
jgi:hypothetical protein